MTNSPLNPFEKRLRERAAYLQQASVPAQSSSEASDVDAPGGRATQHSTAEPRVVWPVVHLDGKPRKQILIVCTANICRSPMVGGILQQRFEQAGLADLVDIRSAGVYGLEHEPASAEGVELLAQRAIDISGHIARPLRAEDLSAASLVIVMEEAHRKAIFVRTPELLHKVVLFSELAGRHEDLADPYRKGRRAYEKTLATIDTTLEAGWANLLKRLEL